MIEQANNMKEELIARRRGYCKLGRNHEPWIDEEIEMLYDMYYSGEDISAIAVIMQRSETAVFNRLRVDGVMQETNKKSIVCSSGEKCRCNKCKIRLDCTKNTEFSVKSTQDFMLDYR